MITTRSPYLDAWLSSVDYRSPASLLEAAAQLEATLPGQDKRIYDKAAELDIMRGARNETSRLAQWLRAEAGYRQTRQDSDPGPTYGEINDARIKGDSPNPVIHD